jgi:acyl-CoA synthetase (AMP-forming)/AMP-acid ligase II
MHDAPVTFADAYDRSARIAGTFMGLGIDPGQRVAVVGGNSLAYLLTWMALQLAGAETAMVNPTYPPELLREMFADLEPAAVIWVGAEPRPAICPAARHLDAARADELVVRDSERDYEAGDPPGELPGLKRAALDIAGYMHTSGTTGTPKFCVQTHEYFLRLGRFIADSMGLTEADTVLAPLPLFHINPLGYGVIGGLVAGADVLSAERFSASGFWPAVKHAEVTAVVLHGPPVEILKRATTRADSRGHRLRVMFFADAGFLEEFEVPMGISAYGSTEAGGLCHVWTWRRGDQPDLTEGMSRYGGRSRHDVEWSVSDDGEILVRSHRAGVLFDGYFRRGEVHRPFDVDGWLRTGDLGRVDVDGNLVFIERAAESIRVKGEFVPIGFVEEHFSRLVGIEDLAIWREPGDLAGSDRVSLYVASEVDVEAIRDARNQLPAFMRPAVLIRVQEIPRDAGVGKVRRRSLGDIEPLETLRLA